MIGEENCRSLLSALVQPIKSAKHILRLFSSQMLFSLYSCLLTPLDSEFLLAPDVRGSEYGSSWPTTVLGEGTGEGWCKMGVPIAEIDARISTVIYQMQYRKRHSCRVHYRWFLLTDGGGIIGDGILRTVGSKSGCI
jgi:hypothetical protein